MKKKEADVISKIKSNPKEFYKYAKKKATGNPDIGPLLDNDGGVTNDVSKITKILSQKYESVFSVPQGDITRIDLAELYTDSDRIFTQVDVTAEIVNEAINEIPNNLSAGPDGILPIFPKKGGSSLRNIWISPI